MLETHAGIVQMVERLPSKEKVGVRVLLPAQYPTRCLLKNHKELLSGSQFRLQHGTQVRFISGYVFVKNAYPVIFVFPLVVC